MSFNDTQQNSRSQFSGRDRTGAAEQIATTPKATRSEAGRKGGLTTPGPGKRRGHIKGVKLARGTKPHAKLPPSVLAAKKAGRPAKLQPDEGTLGLIESLSNIGCTDEEVASMLNVTVATFYAFLKDNKSVQEARERGSTKFRVSIRRKQFAMADKNATILIWLGKQYLGQKDVVEVTNENGPNKIAADASNAGQIAARVAELAERLGYVVPAKPNGAGAAFSCARKLPGIPEEH